MGLIRQALLLFNRERLLEDMESHISLPVMQEIEQNTLQEMIVANQSEKLVEKPL